MRRAAVLAVLLLSVVPSGGPIAAADDITTAATVAAFERWVNAVRNHVPGRSDAEVDMVLALTFDKRRELALGMGFFLSFLSGKPETIKTPAEQLLAHMAGAIRLVPGPDPFLKRAAVLHADAAFKREAEGIGPAEPARPFVTVPRGASAALVEQRTLVVSQDGEVLGQTVAEWNWPFARSLLDLLSVPAADDPFVATWYHATSAFMFQRRLSGEVILHLERAAIVLPDDARVLFDRGSYAELQGLPRTQVLLSDQDVAFRVSRGRGTVRIPAGSGSTLGIPAESDTNDEAERLFRRALRADPSFVEARVRLARLLSVRKRHDEAASELATALAANPTGSVLFYAHLFAGRAAQALGKIAEAAEHYKAADLAFPGAQSARLARSQAALLESDVPGALEQIQRLDKSSGARDPWWWYHLAAGRDADALLREMWTQVPKF